MEPEKKLPDDFNEERKEQVLRVVSRMLQEHFGNTAPAELTLDQELEDLGIESVLLLELLERTREEFGSQISDSLLEARTIGDLCTVVEGRSLAIPATRKSRFASFLAGSTKTSDEASKSLFEDSSLMFYQRGL